jgi:hypothetical protein
MLLTTAEIKADLAPCCLQGFTTTVQNNIGLSVAAEMDVSETWTALMASN